MEQIKLLSKREKEVAELLLQGKSNKQIALALGISDRTVEFHLNKVYEKLHVKSRIEAVLKLGESPGGSVSEKSVKSTVDRIGEDAENGDRFDSQMNRTVSFKDTFSIIGKEPKKMKNLLLSTALFVGVLVLGYLFFTGSAPKAALETATQTPEAQIITPTPIPTLPSPTDTPIVATQTAQQPDLINIGFSPFITLIPASLDPATQSEKIAAQYESIRVNGSAAWAGATLTNDSMYGSFIFNIASLSQKKTITLKYPVHVSITLTDAATDGLNLVTPLAGGGGGPIKEFPPLPLRAGEFDLMPDDPSPVDLVAPDGSVFPYLFKFPCQQAGMFDLAFTIPYNVTDASGVQERVKIYTISFACPQTATLWGLMQAQEDGRVSNIEKLDQWIFENGLYIIQQP